MYKKFYFILKLIFVFSILFDINFNFISSFTTARVALVSLVCITLLRKDRISLSCIYYFLWVGVILMFSTIQFIYSNDFNQSSRLIWFNLYGVLTPFLFVNYIKNRNEFFLLISIAVLIQAFLTILSYLNPSIKQVFSNLIIYTSNFDESNTLRAMGFASVGGASLSVIQSCGIISLLILLKINVWSIIEKILIWVGILIVLISIFFIGRTGLFISIFAFLVYFISISFNIKNWIIATLIIVGVSQINYLKLIENVTSNISGFKSELFISWIENSFQIKGNETKEDLSKMPIPPLSFNTIIGAGRVVKINGFGNASGHDSGYIQTYYSLGLILSIIFYLSYFYFLLFNSNKQKILYLLIIITFIIEIKEPFIFHYSFPFFVLSSILIFGKKNSIKK